MSESSQRPAVPVGHPTERDLDRLTIAVRSVGRECGFPERVTDRYQQWIFLFVGWCLKAPPGEVSRERIGNFWAALNEHPGAEKARICEAMDALGFLFGHLQREARLLFFPDGTTGTDVKNHPRAQDDTGAGFFRPNPSLRARGSAAEGSSSTDTLSNRQLSRYLPSGTLPEEPDARAEIPTQESSQDAVSCEEPRETPQEALEAREERRSRTLFNPEGTAQSPDASASSGGVSGPDEPTGQPRGQDEAKSEDRAEDRAEDGEEGPGQEEGRQQEDPDRVPLQIPRTVADRLEKAARRLGLPPSVFAARAIELVCDDAGIERLETPGAESPLERYQTQIDLVRLQEEHSDAPGSECAGHKDEASPVEREDERSTRAADPDDRNSSPGEGRGDDATSERRSSVEEHRSAEESVSRRGNSGQDPGAWGKVGPSGGDGRGGVVSGSSL